MPFTFFPDDPAGFYFTTLNYVKDDGTPGTLDVADRDVWYEYTQKFYKGVLKQPGLLNRHMFRPNCTRGEPEIPSGAMVLENSDGALDYLMNYAFDAQPVWLARAWNAAGDRSGIFSGTTEQATLDESDLTIAVRDGMYRYLTSALPIKYAGTNVLPAGIEGTAADLKGQPKPMVLGKVKNITPRLVNTSKMIYQVDGQQGLLKHASGNYSLTPYDRRAPIPVGAEYASQADMEATAPAVGQYRVHPASGCFRLGFTPAGQVTADVTNPIWDSAGASPATLTGCEIHVLMWALMSKVVNLGGLPNFYAFWPQRTSPATCFPDGGIYLNEEITAFDAINQLGASVGAGWGSLSSTSASEWIDSWQIRDPLTPGGSVSANLLEIEEWMVKDIAKTPIEDDDNGIPAWRVTVNYRKNYTVQTVTDVGSGSLADLAFVQQEWRSVSVSDATVKVRYPRAQEIVVYTCLDDETAATNEANRLLNIHKVLRHIFNVKVSEQVLPTARHLNIDVLLTHSRFGLGAGKRMILLGYQPNAKDRTSVLTLWG